MRLILLGVVFVAAVVGSDAARKYKLICYYSSWATYRNGYGKFTSQDIDPQLCTHLVYAFNGLDNNFELRVLDPWLSEGSGLDDFRKFTSLKYSNPDLLLMIGVGGWNEGSAKYSQMAAVPRNRKTFIDSTIRFLKQYGFDGLNLDWQYPGNRGGLSVDKQNFVVLLKELREALSAEGFHLGISSPANLEIIDGGYNVPEIMKYVEYVSLLTYDYHGSWDTVTGYNSPLFPPQRSGFSDKSLNQDATVKHWIQKGADKSKLLLGMATYGRSYILRDRTRNSVGDPSYRPANPGPYTQQDGLLGYNEIIEKFTQYGGWVVKHDDTSKVPYAYLDDLWISYDNEWSFGIKAKYITEEQLGGAVVWSLETEDFRGLSGKVNPLINTLKDVMEDGKDMSKVTDAPPTGGPRPTPQILICTGPGSFQHPADCTKYYTCVSVSGGYQPFVNSCPPGLAFDMVTKACNWKDAVPECK